MNPDALAGMFDSSPQRTFPSLTDEAHGEDARTKTRRDFLHRFGYDSGLRNLFNEL